MMKMIIGGVYNINTLDKACFFREAENIGLCGKVALKRFDKLVKNFSKALDAAKLTLINAGFDDAEEIAQQILIKGGIRNYINKN